MPPLSNRRQELFAQGVAKGKHASEAYKEAGYNTSGNAAEASASRLLRDAKVQARVSELQERSAVRTEITVERLTQMLLEDRALARELGQAAPAVAVSEKLAKLHGLWVDRTENENTNFVLSDSPSEADQEEWLRASRPN